MLDSKDFYLNGVSYNFISFFIKSTSIESNIS